MSLTDMKSGGKCLDAYICIHIYWTLIHVYIYIYIYIRVVEEEEEGFY